MKIEIPQKHRRYAANSTARWDEKKSGTGIPVPHRTVQQQQQKDRAARFTPDSQLK
jgi:hypothetical protein